MLVAFISLTTLTGLGCLALSVCGLADGLKETRGMDETRVEGAGELRRLVTSSRLYSLIILKGHQGPRGKWEKGGRGSGQCENCLVDRQVSCITRLICCPDNVFSVPSSLNNLHGRTDGWHL
jgi:hypothetical protein